MKFHVGVASLCVAAMPVRLAYPQSRSFSVKDDIAMVRFSNPLPDPATPGSDTVRSSPDGRYFAFVTTRGLLDSDQVESDIYVFDGEALSAFAKGITPRAPLPRKIATVVSFPHREEANMLAIKDLAGYSLQCVYFKEAEWELSDLCRQSPTAQVLPPLCTSSGVDVLRNLLYTASHTDAAPNIGL